jgi:cell division septum initiation protein DivIVA
MEGTSLLGEARMSADRARRASFPSVILGGYRVADVEAFRSQAAGELETLSRALDDSRAGNQAMLEEVERLRGELARCQNSPQAAAANGQQATNILTFAQAQADKLVGDAELEARQVVMGARHEHDRIIEHARLQAGGLLQQAADDAAAEKARIVGAAAADARREVDFCTRLAAAMRDGLSGQVEILLKNMAEWEQMMRAGAAPAEPSPA